MPKKCPICSDSYCGKEICNKKEYKIKKCEKCPAHFVCNTVYDYGETFCQFTIKEIENLVNGKRE